MERENVLEYLGFLLEIPVKMIVEEYPRFRYLMNQEDKDKLENILQVIGDCGWIKSSEDKSQFIMLPQKFPESIEDESD